MTQIINDAKSKMEASLNMLSKEYSEMQAGRANPKVLDRVSVDYYGTPTPVSQVAAISVSEARILVIQPWDLSLLNGIEKAIQKSDIGINPQNDGKVLRLIFPQLTEERRKDISKEVSSIAENTKIAIRNIRRDAMDKLKNIVSWVDISKRNMKKNSELTEDDHRKSEKKIQDLTDKYCAEIDNICSKKIEKIMSL